MVDDAGEGGKEKPDQTMTEESQDIANDTSASGTKCKTAREITLTTLYDLTNDRWIDGVALREKHVGRHLGRVLKLQHDIASGPESASYLSQVTGCVGALSAAKKVVPAMLAYMTSFASSKLSMAHANAAPLKDFFAKEGKTFGPKARQIFWRGELEDIASTGNFDKVCEKLMSDSVDVVGMHKTITDANDFLKDCIINIVSNFLSSTTAKATTTDAIRDTLTEVITKFKQTLARMDGDHTKFQAALEHALTILDAAQPESKILPGQLIDAKTALSDDDQFKKLWHLWFQSATGTVLLADADMLLVASALDVECSQEFALAQRVLEEGDMPRSENGRLLGSLQMVKTDTMAPLVQDASRQLCKALKSWSPVGIEENAAGICNVINSIGDILAFFDCAAAAVVTMAWHEQIDDWSQHFAKVPLDMNMPLVPEEMANAAGRLMHPEILVDDFDLFQAVQELMNNFTRLKKASPDMARVIDEFQVRYAHALNNFNVLSLLHAEATDLALLVQDSFDKMPVRFPDLIRGYQDDRSASALGVALRVHERRTTGFENAVFAADCDHMAVLDNEDKSQCEIRIREVAVLVQDMLNNNCQRYFTMRFVVNNLQEALTSFWESVEFLTRPVNDAADGEPPMLKELLMFMTAEQAKSLSDDVQNVFDKAGSGFDGKLLRNLAPSTGYEVCSMFAELSKVSMVKLPGVFHGEQGTVQIMDIFSMLHSAYQTCAVFCWVFQKYLRTGGAPIMVTIEAKGADLASMTPDRDFKAAFEFARGTMSNFKQDANRSMTMMNGISGLRFNGLGAQHMLAGLDAILGQAQVVALQRFAAVVEEQATLCEQLCPRFSHIISDEEYKATLAKRQILRAPGRQRLPDAANKLESLMTAAKLEVWLGTQPFASEPWLHDARSLAESTLEMANLAIAVTAACNLIEDFSGSTECIGMAKEFLKEARPKGFPRILVTKVEEIAKRKK